MVLNEINRQLEAKGVIVKRGAIVDASITDTPRRPRGRKEYEVVEDRNKENGQDASGDAMLKEIVKPNVDGGAVGQEDGKAPLWLQAPYGNGRERSGPGRGDNGCQ